MKKFIYDGVEQHEKPNNVSVLFTKTATKLKVELIVEKADGSIISLPLTKKLAGWLISNGTPYGS